MDGDQELLAAWIAGDETKGRQLVERHYSAVHRFFRAKVDGEAADLAQETFLALVRAREDFRAESTFRGYLFGTARNVLRMHYRRKRRKEDRVDLGSQSVVDLGASPSAVAAANSERRLLLEALRRIAVDDQIVLELYHWEDLTGPELARVLGITEAAVRSRLHRARNRLAEVMGELAESPAVLESTLGDLEGWARRARELVGEERIAAVSATKPPDHGDP